MCVCMYVCVAYPCVCRCRCRCRRVYLVDERGDEEEDHMLCACVCVKIDAGLLYMKRKKQRTEPGYYFGLDTFNYLTYLDESMASRQA